MGYPQKRGRCRPRIKQEHSGNRTSLYNIKVYNKDTGKLIAKSQDQAYIKNEYFVPK